MRNKKKYNLQPLDQYIDEALYNTKRGYYNKKNPFGAKGDFITSPSVSVIFSEVLTIWSILYWEKLKCPPEFNIVELGAGSGDMMQQIIKTSNKFKKFKNCAKFFIYEKSKLLIKLQKKKLKKYNVKWLKNFNELSKNKTLFIGNEFLDSFPIKQFEKINGKWFEKYIYETSMERKLKNIGAEIENLKKLVGFNFLKNQNFFEISINQVKLIKNLSNFIVSNGGGILLFDYGYDKLKSIDTLQAVKNHRKVDPLKNKGNVDITHLINFRFLKKLFKRNKLNISGYTTQGKYLKKLGIFERAEIVSKNVNFIKKADIFYRIKRLTHDDDMGKRFKVIFASDTNDFTTGF